MIGPQLQSKCYPLRSVYSKLWAALEGGAYPADNIEIDDLMYKHVESYMAKNKLS